MPGMISHYLCGELCAARLRGRDIGGVVERHRQIYNLGTQGPDFFFYYIPCLIMPKIYRLGNVMHTSRVGQFFGSLLEHAMRLSGSERDAALSYICGYLTHYALDTNAHPYIYYKSGFKTEGDSRPSLHYSIMHRNFETNLDILMLKLASDEKPADKKLWQLISVSHKQAISAAGVISGGLRDVYGIELSKRQVYRAMHSMVAISRVLQSKSGRRKSMIGAVEGLLMPERGYISSLIHDQEACGAQ
ncbi:MAG: zinc dependent phospholipase C family protein, partial [Defluviitaleaceae bacterium]|nr:zinc dependent phospholipase C family protein [Defluviitaleaceae bacterium]